MNKEEQSLYGVPIKTPRVLLERLDALARRREAGEDIPLPVIVLHLPGGRDVRGSVIRLRKDEPKENVLLVHVMGPDLHQPRYHLAYIDPDRVEAITVLDADESALAIGSGAVPEAKSDTFPPSRLEVLRRLAELSKSLSADSGWEFQADVDNAPEAGPAWRDLAALIDQTLAVLREFTADDVALDAFKKTVKKLRFGQENAPSVAFTDGTLWIKANLSKGFDGRLSKADLKSAISKVL